MSSPSLVVENSLIQQHSLSTKVIIVGAGFAGLNAAIQLKKSPVQITLIDKNNYHLFQPLLYQVATAGLSPADITMPIRRIFSRQKNCQVLMDEVIGIDYQKKRVNCKNQSLSFDFLILATGSKHAYFGNDQWQSVALGLKDIDDATQIRRRILTCFEQAENCCSADKRKQLMTFAVVGGGPTGVEMAGAIVELARTTLARDFRRIDPAKARVILIEGGSRILSSFPEKLSKKAAIQLQEMGVEVFFEKMVTDCTDGQIVMNGDEVLAVGQIIWAAGVKASPAATWINAETDDAGRIKVDAYLKVPGFPHTFVAGDTACVIDESGKQVPGVAPAAKQMGKYVGRMIACAVEKKPMPEPFVYKDHGQLATIGRKSAVADLGRYKFSGFFAWVFWGIVHVFYLIGFKNRLFVMLNWMWRYISFGSGARLITGRDNDEPNKRQNKCDYQKGNNKHND